MVGNDPQTGIGQIGGVGFACSSFDQHLKQINFVVGMHMLQHRRQTLQPHAGIYRRFRQRNHWSIRNLAIELHKDQIPDLDVAVAVFVW